MRRGATIHDSTFQSTGDDMIAVLNNPSRVTSVDAGQRTVTAAGLNFGITSQSLAAGDTVIAYRPGRFVESGRATIESVSVDSGTATLRLDSVLGFAADDVLFSPNTSGRGFTVRSTRLTNGVSTAITSRAPDTVIEGNTITHMGQPGIVLSPDLGGGFWAGAYPTNATIRGNIVTDVGRSVLFTRAPWGFGGAIVVGVQSADDPGAVTSNREIRSIRILDNTIDQSPVRGLLVSNASDVLVQGNRIRRTNQEPPGGTGVFWDLPTPREAVLVRDSDNVRFIANEVSGQGSFGDQLVTVDPTADAATIDVSGITRSPSDP